MLVVVTLELAVLLIAGAPRLGVVDGEVYVKPLPALAAEVGVVVVARGYDTLLLVVSDSDVATVSEPAS